MATVNRKWASGIGADGNPVYAPADVIKVNGRKVYNPTDAHYRAAKFVPVVDERPSEPAPEGYHYEAKGWEEVSSSSSSEFENGDNFARIRRVYETVQDPAPPPRVFSKLKIVAALMTAGVWETVKQYIIAGGLYDLFLAAQDFREDNEFFVRGKTALQTALSWTDEQVEAVLAASISEAV